MNSRFGAAVAALIALVVFGAQVARSQILADVLILKSGEKVEGRITAESDLSLTISTENSTGKAERMIPRSEISGVTRSEPLAPAKTPNPDSPEPPDRGSVSPVKKWEYRGPEDGGPKIVKAGTPRPRPMRRTEKSNAIYGPKGASLRDRNGAANRSRGGINVFPVVRRVVRGNFRSCCR
jgi:hypothetical protein